MTQALSVTDQWNVAPVGPVVGDPHTAATYCADLGQITQNATFLFNRCVTPILGEYFKFAAGSVNTGANTITITGHGLSANTVLRYLHVGGTTAMAATGMLAPTVEGFSPSPLYTIVTDANTIQIAGSSGGAALDITAAGDGDHYLFVVPAALDVLMHRAFTHLSGATIPAGSLWATLATFYASTLGATFTGAVTFSNTVACSGAVTHTGTVTHNNVKTVYSSAGAYRVRRTGSLNDAATQTISGYGADLYYCPNVSQNSTYTVSDPPEAGISFVVARRNVGSGFSVALRRADASLMATLPDSGASWVRIWSHAEDGALMWHAEEWGGNATNLD